MKTVAIVYGWAEGEWQSKKFEGELAKQRYKIITNAAKADIIFAHSSGCYLIPKNNKAKAIFLVGLPYWPGRSLAMGVIYKLISEIKYHRQNEGVGWWVNKVAHNIWYVLTRPRSSYYVLTRHKEANLPSGKKEKVILIRPRDDTMCHPETMKLLPAAKTYNFIETPGAHDDCWIKPHQYTELLPSLK